MSPFKEDALMRVPAFDVGRVADVVAAIGAAHFPRAFLAALSDLCGAELCSAFAWTEGEAPVVLFAEGDVANLPAFAQQASLAYAREFWRSDRALRHLGSGVDRVSVLRTAAAGLPDRRHRFDCYERAGIEERLSLYRPGELAFLANGYRTRRAGTFSSEDIANVERFAPILLSAVAKHYELALRQRGEAPVSDTIRMLISTEAGLSGREAQVAAGLIHGHSQREIGAEMNVALSSVVTYRRRAYQKLGVENRRRLLQRYQEICGRAPIAAIAN